MAFMFESRYIIRPTNFDPNRHYPVIEEIYAGPQGSFVPKSFRPFHAMQSLLFFGTMSILG